MMRKTSVNGKCQSSPARLPHPRVKISVSATSAARKYLSTSQTTYRVKMYMGVNCENRAGEGQAQLSFGLRHSTCGFAVCPVYRLCWP